MLTLSYSSQIKQKPWNGRNPLFLSLNPQTHVICSCFCNLSDVMERLPTPAEIIPSLRVPLPLTFQGFCFLIIPPVCCITHLSFGDKLFLLVFKIAHHRTYLNNISLYPLYLFPIFLLRFTAKLLARVVNTNSLHVFSQMVTVQFPTV